MLLESLGGTSIPELGKGMGTREGFLEEMILLLSPKA